MPFKQIDVPAPIRFIDPETGERMKIEGDGGALVAAPAFTFVEFLRQLRHHPLWLTNYECLCAAAGVDQAIAKIRHGRMLLADGDCRLLQAAATTPKRIGGDGKIVEGYAIMPTLAPQLVPFVDAIQKATDAKDDPAEAIAPKAKKKGGGR